jgi:hypothetical protein
MAFSNPQAPNNNIASAATSSALTVSHPASGQLLVCGCSLFSSGTAPVISVTDNASAGWGSPITTAINISSSTIYMYWWFKQASATDASSLTTVTFSWTNGSTQGGGACFMDEYDGFLGKPALDLSPAGVEANTAGITITGGVPAQATELAVGFCGWATSPGAFSSGTYSPNNGTTTYNWTETQSANDLIIRTWAAPAATPATASKWITTMAGAHVHQALGATFYDSYLNVTPAAAAASGVGVAPTAGLGPTPIAAPAAGVGTAAAPGAGIGPAASVASGVGVYATPKVVGVPPAAPTAGVGVNPAIALTVGPASAPATGVGVNPTVTVAEVNNVTPLAALGLGAGVTPFVQGNAMAAPAAAQGIGIGITPSIYAAQQPGSGLCIFLTPQVRDRPPYLPDSSARQVGLMRHFENRLRGVLVWERNDGTYVVDTVCNYEAAMTEPAAYMSDDPIGPDFVPPTPGPPNEQFQGLTDSNVNYPWNPYPGSTNSTIPGSFAYNVNWDRTTQDFALNPYLIQWWEGGAENVITQAQALALTAAGFGDCIRVAGPHAVIGSQPQGQGPYGSQAINA